jgi:hypothetical protein
MSKLTRYTLICVAVAVFTVLWALVARMRPFG